MEKLDVANRIKALRNLKTPSPTLLAYPRHTSINLNAAKKVPPLNTFTTSVAP